MASLPIRSLRLIVLALLPLAAATLPQRPSAAAEAAPRSFELCARSRAMVEGGSGERVAYETLDWDARKTAVVICDMWDDHWCPSAAARVAEMAPRMNRVIAEARRRGALIIHCPSDTMDFYKDHPGRKLALQAPAAETKVPLKGWRPLDKRREGDRLPIDDSDGGCDTPGSKTSRPWTRQIAALEIKPGDAIDDGVQAYHLMRQRGVENVILMGVHTNMCVLGRPFGIRQLVAQGMSVALMRDMTDAMYNPARPPRVSHFRGTELVVEHIERHWCPTVASADLLGGEAFHFRGDKRPHIVLLSNEDEYGSEETLPALAQSLRDRFGYRCTMVFGREKHDLTGIEALGSADLAVLFVRRRALPKPQLDALRAYLDAGKPLVGLRTASHAFTVKGKAPADTQQWPEFDHDVLGGSYHGHSGGKEGSRIAVDAQAAGHPILEGVDRAAWRSNGSLYFVEPLAKDARALVHGAAGDKTAPVAWTHPYKKARIFYSSLGHRDDFQQPQFRRMLINAIHWAMDRPVPSGQGTPQ